MTVYLKDHVAVITLSKQQYDHHIKELPPGRDYFYVQDAKILRGRKDVDFVLVGQWYHRSDLTEIMETLYRININNGVLREKVEKFLYY